jgi:tRNA (cmo5U34)-methyltransferase
MTIDAAAKFDAGRAGEYHRQSRVALAGYEACHELTACILAAAIGQDAPAHLLIAGAGTGQEMVAIGALQPSWRFTAVDPAPAMVELATGRLKAAGLDARVTMRLGYVGDLPPEPTYDGATLIGVLHHLPGEDAKRAILRAIAARLKRNAPFVLACNHYAYASQPLLLAAWRQRWRMHGASESEIDAKLGKILQGADPPPSEAAVAALLTDAGFAPPTRFFSSLFWGAWLARRAA